MTSLPVFVASPSPLPLATGFGWLTQRAKITLTSIGNLQVYCPRLLEYCTAPLPLRNTLWEILNKFEHVQVGSLNSTPPQSPNCIIGYDQLVISRTRAASTLWTAICSTLSSTSWGPTFTIHIIMRDSTEFVDIFPPYGFLAFRIRMTYHTDHLSVQRIQNILTFHV